MGQPGAALAIAGALWLVALSPAAAPQSQCEANAAVRTACEALESVEPVQLLFGRKLDLNTAFASSLEVLPGIGSVRAAAIVAERCRAPFQRVDEIERVAGIGPATRARLAPFVRVNEVPRARCDETIVNTRESKPDD